MSALETADTVFERMVELRRRLHREPELAFEERNTANTLIAALDQLGLPHVYPGVGGGVVARLEGSDPSAPTVALRAEMDALPGVENTNLPFSSTVEGKMHACGHDAHMAMVMGAAELLSRAPPRGTVLFVFQPAEERGGGARVVLRSGALAGVEAIFGGHVTHHYRVGEMMVADGVITAQSDRFKLAVRGKAGHGARPHEAVDAIVVTGLLITSLQTLVSRIVNPAYPSVVTIGTLRAGTAPNVIADAALLEGTIRTTHPDERDRIFAGMRRMSAAIADVYQASVEIEIEAGYPPVVNTSAEAKIARQAALEVLGEQGLVALDHPSLGSEDFSYYLQTIPGCYVRFGARRYETEYVPLHSPQFDIDERVLRVGAAFFDEVARAAIERLRGAA